MGFYVRSFVCCQSFEGLVCTVRNYATVLHEYATSYKSFGHAASIDFYCAVTVNRQSLSVFLCQLFLVLGLRWWLAGFVELY
jgi:hypothetical protein